MSDSVQQIKERLSIIDVISPYVELKKAGKSFKGKSPFTNEKTPSFHVSPDRGMYYCFSSSQGGDMFTFIEKMEGVDFKGALKILAEKAGVELVREDPKKRDERDTQYALIEEACVFFEDQLRENTEAKKYLKNRGVTAGTIGKWRIGYAPGPPEGGWRHLREYLKAKKFTDQQILKAGLIKSTDGGKEPYDVFRDRLMFPISDASGRIVAFSGRLLAKESEAPKYVNSPETELFSKSEILFGYDKAKQGIRSLDFSLLVEGQFDLVLAHQAGYGNAVAVSGTALSSHHTMLLQRLSNKAVLALDADRAGIEAVKRASELMLTRGMDVKVAEIEDGKDPADLIKEDKILFKKVIGGAMHVVEFLLNVIKREVKDERTFKLRVREEVLPLLILMPNKIDREHFENVIAERIGTTKEAIHHEIERLSDVDETAHIIEHSTVGDDTTGKIKTYSRKDEILSYLIVAVEVIGGTIGARIQEHVSDITEKDIKALKKDMKTSKRSELLFKLEEEFSTYSERQLAEEIADKLTELKKTTLKVKLSGIRMRIKEAEEAVDEKEVLKQINYSNEVQMSLRDISFPLSDFMTEEVKEG